MDPLTMAMLASFAGGGFDVQNLQGDYRYRGCIKKVYLDPPVEGRGWTLRVDLAWNTMAIAKSFDGSQVCSLVPAGGWAEVYKLYFVIELSSSASADDGWRAPDLLWSKVGLIVNCNATGDVVIMSLRSETAPHDSNVGWLPDGPRATSLHVEGLESE